MKTVVIWSEEPEFIKFFILEGDRRDLDKVVINSGENEDKETELVEIVFDQDGHRKVQLLEDFPVDEVKAGAFVIVAVFLA